MRLILLALARLQMRLVDADLTWAHVCRRWTDEAHGRAEIRMTMACGLLERARRLA